MWWKSMPSAKLSSLFIDWKGLLGFCAGQATNWKTEYLPFQPVDFSPQTTVDLISQSSVVSLDLGEWVLLRSRSSMWVVVMGPRNVVGGDQECQPHLNHVEVALLSEQGGKDVRQAKTDTHSRVKWKWFLYIIITKILLKSYHMRSQTDWIFSSYNVVTMVEISRPVCQGHSLVSPHT